MCSKLLAAGSHTCRRSWAKPCCMCCTDGRFACVECLPPCSRPNRPLAHLSLSPLPATQNGKTTIKCPKIQRLVTPQVLQRKRRRAAIKKERITRKKTEVRLAAMCLLVCGESALPCVGVNWVRHGSLHVARPAATPKTACPRAPMLTCLPASLCPPLPSPSSGR